MKRFAIICLLPLLLCTHVTREVIAGENGLTWKTPIWWADNGQNDAMLWGGEISGLVGASYVATIAYMAGNFNQGGDIERLDDFTLMAGWSQGMWEAGGGFIYHRITTDLQRGFVWSYPDEEIERNADIFGPALYGRVCQNLLSPHAQLFLQVTLLPHDFGDLNDIDFNGRFAQLHAGWRWTEERWQFAAGYQLRRYDDLPQRIINDETFARDDIQGFIMELGLRF